MHTLLCHLGRKELIKDAIQTSSDVEEKSFSHRNVEKDLQVLLRQFLPLQVTIAATILLHKDHCMCSCVVT